MVDINIEQHFRSDEVPFLESMDSLVGRVQNEYRDLLTDFLNPRQQFILQTVVNRYDGVKLSFFGGFEDSEMKRALIYPDYFEPQQADFQVSAYDIDYPQKFATLSHGQILGSLMGSGIEREVIGDIITDGTNWQFMVKAEMADYVASQLDHVGKVKVRLKPVALDHLLNPNQEFETVTTTVSSLRLDVLVAEGAHISRHHAKELVETGRVRVNWAENQRPDYELGVSDIISVRGFGRIVLLEIGGMTKKDKIRVTLNLIKPNK